MEGQRRILDLCVDAGETLLANGAEIYRVQQTMEIIEGLPKIRKALSVPDGVALIMMSSDYKDVNGRAIAFTRSFIRSDKSSFRIKMHG